MQQHLPESSGAQCIAQMLRQHGVAEVYGVCGDHINSLYAALHQHGISLIGMRHESAAIQMADGYARCTGLPTVVAVTGGPGHTNAITGLAVAQAAASPVILISGLTPVVYRHRGGQQVMEQAQIAAPVTKLAREVLHADYICEEIAEAFRVATSATPGPVSLSIPTDVLAQPVSPRASSRYMQANFGANNNSAGLKKNSGDTSHMLSATDGIDVALELLAAAQRPAVILGSQAWRGSPTSVLPATISKLGIPAFTVEQARGMIPDDGNTCFGYADPFFNACFRKIRQADLIILAGACIDFHTCFGGEQLIDPNARVVQIHTDPLKFDTCIPADIKLSGDPIEILQWMANKSGMAGRFQSWHQQIRAAYDKATDSWDEQLALLPTSTQHTHPLKLCASLARHVTPRTGIVVDAGDFVHWPRAFFRAQTPGHWMDASLMGNLGGSIPLAMGMQKAFPQDPVWAFVGDGGFGFYSWELATAAQEGLPIKIIVGNDQAWGIEKRLQMSEFGHHIGCDLPYTRYDRYAELMGAAGFHVSDPTALDDTIAEFVQTKGPAVLNVDIPPLAGRPLGDFERY